AWVLAWLPAAKVVGLLLLGCLPGCLRPLGVSGRRLGLGSGRARGAGREEASCHLRSAALRIPFEPPQPCASSSETPPAEGGSGRPSGACGSHLLPTTTTTTSWPAGRTNGARPTTSSARRPSAAAAAPGRFRAGAGTPGIPRPRVLDRSIRDRPCPRDPRHCGLVRWLGVRTPAPARRLAATEKKDLLDAAFAAAAGTPD
ncbi:hypothetical protein PVAP13_3NG101872, partial [Panicum virgatum]